MDANNVFRWLKFVLETPIDKVGANLLYDIGWLTEENIFVGGKLFDVQFAEALLDEEAEVNLDRLGWHYLQEGKTSNLMYEWIRRAYPNTPEKKLRANIYRTSPKLVGAYAEDDADLPVRIIQKQLPLLQQQGLEDIFDMECELIPLLVRMRMEGVSVDLNYANTLAGEMERDIRQIYDRIGREYGYRIESSQGPQVGRLLEHAGVAVPRTEIGNPSVTKDWLAALEHPLGEIITDLREREKLVGTFIRSYMIKKNINGKIYPQFHPLKGETNGTKVGRLASSDPNLQNIPSRTALGKRVRQCFIPDDGHDHWCKMDYSQIHYRILAHFAVGPGSDELRASYINDPKMDYHDNIFDKVAPIMGWETTDAKKRKYYRKPVKNVNFGLMYGMSLYKLMRSTAAYFGGAFTKQQAQAFMDIYFAQAPYMKPTMEAIEQEVQTHGFTTSVLGRRCRFNLWEPNIPGFRGDPLHHEYALNTWGSNIKRAYGYRGVNYKFQSSEPDFIKTGMLKCLRSGVFDYTGVPRLTVHDEIDFSVREDSPRMREAFAYIQHTLEHAVKIRVPMFVDADRGVNWGLVD